MVKIAPKNIVIMLCLFFPESIALHCAMSGVETNLSETTIPDLNKHFILDDLKLPFNKHITSAILKLKKSLLL